jgi:hypothetical protein
MILFLPAITCLLLALEWGAAEYSWSSPRLIALLVVFAVLFLAFVVWQYCTRHTTATVPARIVFQRSVAFGGFSQFCVGSTMLTVSIYVPLWFQAIKEVSAMQSGINTIPLCSGWVHHVRWPDSAHWVLHAFHDRWLEFDGDRNRTSYNMEYAHK